MKYEEKKTLWLERVQAYRSSKLPITVWCEKNEVSVHTLRTWITKFNKENTSHDTSNQWLAVEISSSSTKAAGKMTSSAIVINIGSASIEVSPEFDPKTSGTVLQILSRQC